MEGLDVITDDLRKFFNKIEYTEIAQKYYKEAHTEKEAVFDKVFAPAYKMIENFNEKAKKTEETAKRVG